MSCSGVDRRDQILADAALQQLAIEHHVVDVADDDHLRARVAVLGQLVELGQDLVARQAALDDDQVRRRVLLIVRDRRLDAAHVHADVRLGQPAILGGDLHDLGRRAVLAERLDRDARNGPRAHRGRIAAPSPSSPTGAPTPTSSSGLMIGLG